MRKHNFSQDVLSKSRKHKSLVRKRKKDRLNKKYNSKQVSQLKFSRKSYVIDSFSNQIKFNNKFRHLKEFTLTIPSTFSILDSPEETLKTIYKLVEVNFGSKKLKKIYFDHENMENFDLSAAQVLGHLASELNRIKHKKNKIRMSGNFPKDNEASRFLRGVGVINKLGLTQKYLSKKEQESLKIFSKTDNRALREIRSASEITEREKATKGFVDHINACLGENGYQLTREGIQSLCNISGEVIDNAVQHSKGDDWVLAGYLDPQTTENVCEISAFNFGRSIAQTLADLPDDHYTTKIIQPYLDQHIKSGFFSSAWTKEDLLTLVALQGNVSSKNESDDNTRGSGTVDILEFFKGVYDESGKDCKANIKMAILSGKTHITFDGKYSINNDSTNRKVIALNDENDLSKRPDPKYIKHLNGYPFPGTIISIKFPLQNKRLEEKVT